jgi:hypothetical protein
MSISRVDRPQTLRRAGLQVDSTAVQYARNRRLRRPPVIAWGGDRRTRHDLEYGAYAGALLDPLRVGLLSRIDLAELRGLPRVSSPLFPSAQCT